MIICGLKLTHDGAIALLDGDRLVFSVEMEKLDNRPRFSRIDDLAVVPKILADFGYEVADVDVWAIDGWDGIENSTVVTADHGRPVEVIVAPYRESPHRSDILTPGHRGELPIGGRPQPYVSYVHVAGHLASAYCTSPFAGSPAFVLVWDGGLFPRLYHVDPATGVENGGELFPLVGHVYAMAARHFGPFPRREGPVHEELSLAGTLMAYIALGTPRAEVKSVLRDLFHTHFEADTPEAARYRAQVGGFGSNCEPSFAYTDAYFAAARAQLTAPDEDVLASVHEFLQELLVERVTARIRAWKGEGPWNLSFVGGCALNIKWNSALRALPLFAEVWVPPFPNDSGSAIGVACAHRAAMEKLTAVAWHPRSGPALLPTPAVPEGWTVRPCSATELAGVLHDSGAPVVVLDGRAELGPRALGGRSIIAPAHDAGMKDQLNAIKDRAGYRPVAPICLTDAAPAVFDPGTPDPHMLFEHRVRPEWRDRVPAVLHLDGTARLQTVNADDDPVLETVLREYQRLTGVPVLCNTSANRNGSGFFPDVASAVAWGRIDRVWSDGQLYEKV